MTSHTRAELRNMARDTASRMVAEHGPVKAMSMCNQWIMDGSVDREYGEILLNVLSSHLLNRRIPQPKVKRQICGQTKLFP